VLIRPISQPEYRKAFGMAKQPVPNPHFRTFMKVSKSLGTRKAEESDTTLESIPSYDNLLSFAKGE